MKNTTKSYILIFITISLIGLYWSAHNFWWRSFGFLGYLIIGYIFGEWAFMKDKLAAIFKEATSMKELFTLMKDREISNLEKKLDQMENEERLHSKD